MTRLGIYVADLLRGVWLQECHETRGFSTEPQDRLNDWLHAVSWWLYEHLDGNYIRDEDGEGE